MACEARHRRSGKAQQCRDYQNKAHRKFLRIFSLDRFTQARMVVDLDHSVD
jgi:hypothetical protein